MFENKRNDVFAGYIAKWLGIEFCRLIVYLFCHDVFHLLATSLMRFDAAFYSFGMVEGNVVHGGLRNKNPAPPT